MSLTQHDRYIDCTDAQKVVINALVEVANYGAWQFQLWIGYRDLMDERPHKKDVVVVVDNDHNEYLINRDGTVEHISTIEKNERTEMEAAGFEYDPAGFNNRSRWSHFKKGITVLRQPYMNEAQWIDCRRFKLVQAADMFDLNQG